MHQLIMITDYKSGGPKVGLLKSVITNNCPTIKMMDMAHDLPCDDIGYAAYIVKSHLALELSNCIYLTSVNNYASPIPKYIVFEKDGNYFIGPDNGLYALVFEDLEEMTIYAVDTSKVKNTDAASIYAHCVACIHHKLPLDELGEIDKDLDFKIMFHPVVTKDTIRATVTHVDEFGNAVTNLSRSTFERARDSRSFQLFYDPRNPITKINDHHGQSALGEVSCIFNRTGYLEIGVNQGKIAELYNLNKNETIQIDFL